MRRFCRISNVVLCVVGALGLVACKGERVPQNSDSALGVAPAEAGVAVTPVFGKPWDAAIGPAVLLATGAFPDSAMVVRPDYVEGRLTDTSTVDLSDVSHMQVDLFGRGGFFGAATLSISNPLQGVGGNCVSWPLGTVSAMRDGWRVALAAGRATAIALDSIEALPSHDSSSMAALVTRLASSIPAAKDSVFVGVPFLVRSAYRFRAGSVEGIVAVVQRSIPSEADPREERMTIIAERTTGSTGDYQVAYVNRVVERWETTRDVDILAMLSLVPSGRMMIAVSFQGDTRSSIGFIERVAVGTWREIWESARVGC